MLLRMVKLIIKQNRQLENARVALFSHQTFSLQDSFNLFDINQNGRISADEITQVFKDHSIPLSNVPRLIEIFDTNDDRTIAFGEWFATLKPRRAVQSVEPISNLTMEQKTLFEKAWLDQLGEFFSTLLQADQDLNAKRNQLQLNGERLFSDMDWHD